VRLPTVSKRGLINYLATEKGGLRFTSEMGGAGGRFEKGPAKKLEKFEKTSRGGAAAGQG